MTSAINIAVIPMRPPLRPPIVAGFESAALRGSKADAVLRAVEELLLIDNVPGPTEVAAVGADGTSEIVCVIDTV